MLIVRSHALRSTLVARLGLEGETFVTASSHDDAALGEDLRRSAVLVISQACLPPDQGIWERTLRDGGWAGNIIVMMGTPPAEVPPAAGFFPIPKKRAAAAIRALLDEWRGSAG